MRRLEKKEGKEENLQKIERKKKRKRDEEEKRGRRRVFCRTRRGGKKVRGEEGKEETNAGTSRVILPRAPKARRD